MPRKRGGVEVVVTAGLLAFAVSGCAYMEPDPYPTPSYEAAGTPIPEGVDYVRAVQCGGLLWAIQAGEHRISRSRDFPGSYYAERDNDYLVSQTGLYIEWAEKLAEQAGDDPALARPDIAASRDLIIASTGGISPLGNAEEILRNLRERCQSMLIHGLSRAQRSHFYRRVNSASITISTSSPTTEE
jgi:hypothetical protein